MTATVDFGKKFEKLPDILEHYDNKFIEFKQYSDAGVFSGRTIEQVIIENSSWHGICDEYVAELNKIHTNMVIRSDGLRGELYQGIKKTSQVALGEREVLKYIDADPDYIMIRCYIAEIRELQEMFDAAAKRCKDISYKIGHIVKMRVAELEDIIL